MVEINKDIVPAYLDDKDIMGYDFMTDISDFSEVVVNEKMKKYKYVGFVNGMPFYARYVFGGSSIRFYAFRKDDLEELSESLKNRLSDADNNGVFFDISITKDDTVKISFYRKQTDNEE